MTLALEIDVFEPFYLEKTFVVGLKDLSVISPVIPLATLMLAVAFKSVETRLTKRKYFPNNLEKLSRQNCMVTQFASSFQIVFFHSPKPF